MVKKKDSLIEEAEKIKADLDALKKKILDENSAKKPATRIKNQGGPCKGFCKKFKAKRPSNGKRYDSGQGRCQICEQWINYQGAHLKNKQPATENSSGWYCNCCNYRIRQKPRNKIYKEKLANDVAEKKIIFELINKNPCRICGIKPTVENIESVFGMRQSGGKSIRQSQCRKCRNIHSSQTKKIPVKILKLSTEKINRLISKALTLIRKKPIGIYNVILMKELKILENEFKEILPKLTRLEDIVEVSEDWGDGSSKKLLKSVTVKEKTVLPKKLKNMSKGTIGIQSELSFDIDQLRDEMGLKLEKEFQTIKKTQSKKESNLAVNVDQLRNEIKELEKNSIARYEEREKLREQIKNPNSSKSNSKLGIEIECNEVIKYKRKKIDVGLVRELFLEYAELGSIKKICEKHPWTDEEKIRRHLQTPKRLPRKLQERVHDLVADPESSLAIAMYATDYFNWDGDKTEEDKIVNFVEKLQKGFERNNQLRLELMGKIIKK